MQFNNNALNMVGGYQTNRFHVQPQFNGDSTGIIFQDNLCVYIQIGSVVLFSGAIFFSNKGTFSPTDIFSFSFSGFPDMVGPEGGAVNIGNNIPCIDMAGNINFLVLDGNSSPSLFYLSANPKVVSTPSYFFDTTTAAIYSDFTNDSGFYFNGFFHVGM